MSTEYINGFYDARNLAWESKKEQLESLDPRLKQIGGKAFNKEFRTINLDFGRQTGNTYWMMNKCSELSLNEKTKVKTTIKTEHCFCFFLNHEIESRFWQSLCDFKKEKINQKSTNIHTYTFYTIKNGISHINNSYAFIDVSCMLGQYELERIMHSDQWEIICLL